MPTFFRILFLPLVFLLTLGVPASAAPNAQPQLGITFLNLEPGMKGDLALYWQGDPAARADVYVDFDGDLGWSAGELVLTAAALDQSVALHKIEIPAAAKLSNETRIRVLVRGSSREVLLDEVRPLYPPAENSSSVAQCEWRPGFSAAKPQYALSAMAIFDDGNGASLHVAIEKTLPDPDLGTVSVSYLQKWNGSSWQTLGTVISGSIYALWVFEGRLFAGGNFELPNISRLAAWDGQSWQAVGTPNGVVKALVSFQDQLFVGGAFTTMNGVAASRIASFDGQSWRSYGDGDAGEVRAFKVWNGSLIVAGTFTQVGGTAANRIAAFSGSQWSSLGNGLLGPVNALEVLGDEPGVLYAGGVGVLRINSKTTTALAKWNGSWSDAGVVNNEIFALRSFGNTLYAAGSFTTAGGNSVSLLATYTGSQWQGLGNYGVGTIRQLLTGFDSQPVLYIGGTFTKVPSGAAIPYFSRFANNTFSLLGQGLDGPVLALEPSSLDLLAGGAFLNAAGLNVQRTARWSGGSWFPFGAGVGTKVNAMVVWDDGSGAATYAGSEQDVLKWNGTTWKSVLNTKSAVRSFAIFSGTLYAGTATKGLYRWNGTKWVAVAGSPQKIYSLVVGESSLYVGGPFSDSHGNYIARYNGSTWSTLPPGFSAAVNALAWHEGSLYAGGDFLSTSAGNVTLDHLAKWDGANWTPLGNGTQGPVTALESVDLEAGHPLLAVGGTFSKVNRQAANNLAFWDAATQDWQIPGYGVGGPVQTLAQIDTADRTLYVGGSFLSAGGMPSSNLARWVCPSPASIDAEILKASGPGPVLSGERHSYTITVRSIGSNTVHDQVVLDSFDTSRLAGCAWTASGEGHASGYSAGEGDELRQVLNLPAGSSVTYGITCSVKNSARGTLVNTARLLEEDADPANNSATVSDEIVPQEIGSGDCDGNSFLESLDREAIHREIFDGDGNLPDDVPGGGFFGHVEGCNANGEDTVDAGDLACLELLLAGQTCEESLPNGGVPLLKLPTHLLVVAHQTLATITLEPAGQDLRSIAFSLEYDASVVAPASDLLAHIQRSSLPADAILQLQENSAAHRLDFTISVPGTEPLDWGVLIRVPFTVNLAWEEGTLLHKIELLAGSQSFGDQLGRSVAGLVHPSQESVKTLILTHTGRLAAFPELGFADAASRAELLTRLQRFASHPQVHGLVVDLDDYGGPLETLYETWQPGTPNAEDANQVLLADGGLIEIVENLLATFPTAEYLQIVGDDRIVPMGRVPDATALSEASYVGTGPLAHLSSASPTGQSLLADYYLSDSLLASGEQNTVLAFLDGQNLDVLLPRLVTGRLVENRDEIFRALDRFFELDGVVDLFAADPNQRQVLVEGYDDLWASGKAIARAWSSILPEGLPGAATPVDARWLGYGWQGAELFSALSNGDGLGPARILFLAGHGSHHEIAAPSPGTGLTSAQLYGATCAEQSGGFDLDGALFFSLADHGGLNVPGSCAGAPDEALDLAQTLLGRGALAFGDNSGFGWGNRWGSGLGERFLMALEGELPNGEVGAALRRARLRYLAATQHFDLYDRKTLLQWNLYGFPMVRLEGLAGARTPSLEEPTYGPEGADGFRSATLGAVRIRRRIGHEGSAAAPPLPPYLTRAEIELDLGAPGVYQLFDRDEEPVVDGICPLEGCYSALNSLATDESDLPILPFFSLSTSFSGTLPRQGLWLGGSYGPLTPWHPLFGEPVSASALPVADRDELPSHLLYLPRSQSGADALPDGRRGCGKVAGRGAEHGQFNMATAELLRGENGWQQRTFDRMDFETYYLSRDATDCEGPSLEQIDEVVAAGRLTIRVAATDSGAGVWRVVVVWDNELGARFEPLELELESGVWQGTIDAAGRERIRYFVQAVDFEGNTTISRQVLTEPASRVALEMLDLREVTIPAIEADLSLELHFATGTVLAGGTVEAISTLTNSGPDSTSAAITWTLPAAFPLLATGADGWTCSSTGSQELTCEKASVAAFETETLRLFLQAPALGSPLPAELCGQIVGDAASQVCAEVVVLDANMTDLRVVGAVAISGNEASFSFRVDNQDHLVNGAQLTVEMPASLSNLSWTCSAASGDFCHGGTQTSGPILDTVHLAAGHSLLYQGTATYDPGRAGASNVIATIAPPAGMTDYRPKNNTLFLSIETLGALFADGFESGQCLGWSQCGPTAPPQP